jgi:hypothetical protein
MAQNMGPGGGMNLSGIGAGVSSSTVVRIIGQHAVTNGGATVDGQAISNGAVIVTSGGGGGVSGATVTNIVGGIMATGACATASTVTGAQSNIIAAALTNAADFYPASNPSYYQTAAQVQGTAATVAGNVFTSFIGNPYSYRGSFTGHVLATSGNVLTNAADFATAAQGGKADTALQPAATNGWTITSHAAFLTAESDPVFATNGVKRSDTNGWTITSHAGFATNAGGAGAGYYAMSNGSWTAFAPGAGGTANAVTNGGARVDGQFITNGASITTSGGMSGETVTNIVISVGTAQGWSTNTAWTWQGAQTVPVPTSAYTIAYGGPAVWNADSNWFDVLPYSTTNYGAVTGTVTITMTGNVYLSSVGGTWYYKSITDMTKPGATPVFYSLSQPTSTSAVLSAWCSTNPADAASDYYSYFSNLVVYSYDRSSMAPYQYTNDAAGIVARVDSLPAGNTDTRRVVNAESLTAAIAAAKADAAKEAWNYTPSGARQPNYSVLTIDKPMVQQQAGIVYMQAGNYFAQSYRGTWDNSVTGSVWRVGPSGRMAFEITSTNIGLAISSFSVVTNTAFFTIETNGVVGTPYIEYSADLVASQWLIAPGQSMVNNTTNWTASCPTVATMLFFRAISPGGENAINSYYRHVFLAGVSGDGSGWTNISAGQVGAASNTPAGIAAAGGITGAVFAASGTAPSVAAGLLSIPTNSFGGGTSGGISAADATNIVRATMARFAVTNTFTVTNSATFSIPLPYSSVCLDDVRVFATTVGTYSKRCALRFFRSPGPSFRRTHLAYTFTNGLIYATTTTVAQAAGSITNVVPDASGIVWPIDMYYQTYGGGTNDFISYTNTSATVLWQCCTNQYAQPVGSLISHVEQLGSFNYWDASGGSSLYGDIVPTTGWTGAVTVVISGALR